MKYTPNHQIIRTIKMVLEITADIQLLYSNMIKLKNCTNNLSERLNATQYLTYFNCGHVTITDKNKTTTRQFTLIVEENHTIPISTVGHMFKAWTYNRTL